MANSSFFPLALLEHSGDCEYHEAVAGEGEIECEGGWVVLRLGQGRQEGDDLQSTAAQQLHLYIGLILIFVNKIILTMSGKEEGISLFRGFSGLIYPEKQIGQETRCYVTFSGKN